MKKHSPADIPDQEMIPTFTRKNGRIISKLKPRFIETGTQDLSRPKAKKAIRAEINDMIQTIKSSEKGSSVLIQKKNSHDFSHRAYTESTFPKWFRTLNVPSKDFEKVAKSRKGVRYNRIRDIAVDRLNRGYQNKHGYNYPDTKFMVDSGKLYDNKSVIFRKIRGKIVPLRVPKRDRYDLMDEAPF